MTSAGWAFNESYGVWLNESLSECLLNLAIQRRGGGAVENSKALHCTQIGRRLPEFGRSMNVNYPGLESKIVDIIVVFLSRVEVWARFPHLRRGGDSKYLCSCGETIDTRDFGRKVETHRYLFPTHVLALSRTLGDIVAVYGVAEKLVDQLVEGEEISANLTTLQVGG